MIPQRYDALGGYVELSNGDLILYTDAEKWVGKEVAIIQNEKELAEEHLRLDTITWEKALKKRDKEIRKLSARIQKDSRPCPPCEHLDEKIKEVAALKADNENMAKLNDSFPEEIARLEDAVAALKTFIKEKLHLKYPHGANGCCCLFDDDENQIQWCSVHKVLRDEVAALTEELESHAWKISPAMAQAQIDELSREIAALKENVNQLVITKP